MSSSSFWLFLAPNILFLLLFFAVFFFLVCKIARKKNMLYVQTNCWIQSWNSLIPIAESHRDKQLFAMLAVMHMLNPKQNKLKQNENKRHWTTGIQDWSPKCLVSKSKKKALSVKRNMAEKTMCNVQKQRKGEMTRSTHSFLWFLINQSHTTTFPNPKQQCQC
jgi:hypothetical protein